MTDLAAPFSPDWVSPPGDSIIDIIEERDWTQAELAKRLGYTKKHVNQLIKGKVPLTEDAAIRLERVLGSTVGFWLAREAKYRERCARLNATAESTEWFSWLEVLPVKELMAAGSIEKSRIIDKNKSSIVDSCLRFFGVASPDEWQSHYGQMQAAFRRSRAEQSDIGAISSWLRMGEQEAEKLDGPKYDQNRFELALKEIRKLTTQPPEKFQPQIQKLFHEAGVVFVLVPAIPKAHVSGVARWLNPHRPLIQLSLYGKTNDKFWFTLFHEAAHVLLHSKKSVYLDDSNKDLITTDEEDEANNWAGNFLIPAQHNQALSTLRTKQAVRAFSSTIGVHPGIVVGRLQHDKIIDPSWFNDLKQSFQLISK
jgi:HTH-type transcriptional regulator / antitoxin HigA